jgi:hypothetical protein
LRDLRPTAAKSRIRACPGLDPGCGINFEPRFDRFDKLTAGRRLTVLPTLSKVEGSEVEVGSRKILNFLDAPGSEPGMTDLDIAKFYRIYFCNI